MEINAKEPRHRCVWRYLVAPLALSAVCMTTVGCAMPTINRREVRSVTSSEGSVQFMYVQKVNQSYNRGIVECNVDDNGELQGCKDIMTQFKSPATEGNQSILGGSS